MSHRFEVGERVTYEEKRFPNTVRRTELIVVERLGGSGEPQHQLFGDGLTSCVLGESELRPRSALRLILVKRAYPIAIQEALGIRQCTVHQHSDDDRCG